MARIATGEAGRTVALAIERQYGDGDLQSVTRQAVAPDPSPNNRSNWHRFGGRSATSVDHNILWTQSNFPSVR